MSTATNLGKRSQKSRGAFFTPKPIADFLTKWAIRSSDARVIDPTCGESVFLLAAAERLKKLGASSQSVANQLTGVDLHAPSLRASEKLLSERGYGAKFIESDFFDLSTPNQIGDRVGWQDAVIGNPPFVRYQELGREARVKTAAAALTQGVRLSGLASSWAASLVHASAFLSPEGRLAMVLPAELLSVHYAEPVRRWLRNRFGRVNLVMFENLQFEGASERVVLLVASDAGPCESFCLHYVDDAEDLDELHPMDPVGTVPASEGKWSDISLAPDTRRLFKAVTDEQMSSLGSYGSVELGTVTGANDFFAISEATRRKYGLTEKQLKKMSPPGTKHLKGFAFSPVQWEELRLSGERVWMLHPEANSKSKGLAAYVKSGEERGVHEGYKCSIREPWWRPPVVSPPDLLFTYMSHRYPRLIANTAKVTIVNSMHGVRLDSSVSKKVREALPLLCLNSLTMLGAEIFGRSYGGGILKMEPKEAAMLPLPSVESAEKAWTGLVSQRRNLDAQLQRGEWWSVVAEVDRVLLKDVMGLSPDQVTTIRDAAAVLRIRRTGQTEPHGSTQT